MKSLRLAARFVGWMLLMLTVTVSFAPAQQSYLEQHYLKKEYRIAMRDGARLYTSVYLPKDQSRRYPILMLRTPYSAGPYGENAYRTDRFESWRHLAEAGFIFVFQDVRGRFMSEGEYVNVRPHLTDKGSEKDVDESSDTYDTIEWLINNLPNHNGRVGMWGISYPGFYAAMGAIDAHPALKAVSPQAPVCDWFIGDDFHHNGTFNLALSFGFFTSFGVARPELTTEWPPRFDYGTPDGYDFFLKMGPLPNANQRYLKGEIAFWNDMMAHGTYDSFWKSRRTTQYFNGIKPAVLVVGGWFDAEDCYGALQTYQAIEKRNPQIDNFLVMGPWYHGGWVRSDGSALGDIQFGGPTGEFYIEHIELPFFNYYLKDQTAHNLPEAYVFETGGNQWHRFDVWPPENVSNKPLYLSEAGQLAYEAPAPRNIFTADEYISDPALPVPFTADIATGMPRTFMVEDQRFAARRPDVLVYESAVLDSDVTIAGPVEVKFYVSTTGTDSDWIVKLVDVFPGETPDNEATGAKMGGYQMLLRGDVMRGKFRHSFEHPIAMPPGTVVEIEFVMNDVMHTFGKGHKIMVQVQSSWFPYVDRNPQTFVDIYNAKASDFRSATQKIYRSGKYPSHLVLPVWGE